MNERNIYMDCINGVCWVDIGQGKWLTQQTEPCGSVEVLLQSLVPRALIQFISNIKSSKKKGGSTYIFLHYCCPLQMWQPMSSHPGDDNTEYKTNRGRHVLHVRILGNSLLMISVCFVASDLLEVERTKMTHRDLDLSLEHRSVRELERLTE